MKYAIKPYIAVENTDYQTMASEIMNFTRSQLEEIIATMKKVLNGEIESSSFSQNIVLVEYDSRKAIIKHFNDTVGEEMTIDIYTMMVEYLTIRRASKSNFDYPA